MYYGGAAAVIAAYDITNKDSYSRAKEWVERLRQHGDKNCVIVLVGNKADLIEKREIPKEVAEAYAKENDLLFMETSAKTGMNVNELFEMIVRSVFISELEPVLFHTGKYVTNFFSSNKWTCCGNKDQNSTLCNVSNAKDKPKITKATKKTTTTKDALKSSTSSGETKTSASTLVKHKSATPYNKTDLHGNRYVLTRYILLGDSTCGKTALLKRFTDNRWVGDCNWHTTGVEFGVRQIDIDGETIKLQIWDPSGQDRFRSIWNSYIGGSDAIIFCYSLTGSARNLENWIDDISKNTESQNDYVTHGIVTPIIICGTKCDSSEKNNDTLIFAKKFASDHGYLHFETSAKNDINVQELFTEAAKLAITFLAETSAENDRINLQNQKKKSGKSKKGWFFTRKQ